MLRRSRRRVITSVVLATLAVLIGGPPVRAAGLLIADGGAGGVLEMKEHTVKVTINNGVVVTEVEQVFVNTEPRIVEALYTFPVPNDASVSGFGMWINGREMTGEVVEKQRAREIYNSYKQQRKDPGLLEQVDYKRFEMRIFPIGPRAEQRVRITYCQELDFDHDRATYTYPLATVTQRGVDTKVTGKFGLSLQARSAVPIVEMASPSHAQQFAIVRSSDNLYQASLEASGGDLSRDLVVTYRLQRPRTGIDVIASRTGGEDGYFLLTLTPGPELEEAAGPMDYIFVLDISGSMAADGKLRMSRDSIGAFIETLGEQDRFEVITFNIAANPLFKTLTAADAEAKKKAAAFIAEQQARGGTVLEPAISAAYRYHNPDRPLNVVILSDGMTEPAEQRELVRLMGARPGGTRVFCVGVGNEVNRPLLRQLAADAGGLSAFVSQEDDLQAAAQSFRRKLMRPAATDVKITFADGGVYDMQPQPLPNLYHGAPLRLYGRYRRPGAATMKLTAEVLGRPIEQTMAIDLPETDESNPQIERMWAWRRVQGLMDEARTNGSPASTTGEIVRLCETYSIASEYASFIVLENDAEYQRWRIERRNLGRSERDQRAMVWLQQQFEEMRRKAAAANVGPVDALAARPTADPGVASSSSSSAAPAASTPSPGAPRRGWDLSTPMPRGGGGGGAIDPVTGVVMLALGAAAMAARRRK